jgi:hypothetical protein
MVAAGSSATGGVAGGFAAGGCAAGGCVDEAPAESLGAVGAEFAPNVEPLEAEPPTPNEGGPGRDPPEGGTV